MFKTILTIIQVLPEILRIAKSLIETVKDMLDKQEKKERLRKVKEGLDEARDKKDTSKLEEAFGCGRFCKPEPGSDGESKL